jgi:hypothetical protein
MASGIDLTGQRFGRLSVVSLASPAATGERMWTCNCDCGNTCTVRGAQLRKQKTRSCGCYKRERARELYTINLVGHRYGRLIVIRQAANRSPTRTAWHCRCDCGKETVAVGHELRAGHTTSCGCRNRECRTAFSKSRFVDLTGRRFGRLVVTGRAGSAGRVTKKATWHCRCDCGNMTAPVASKLLMGLTVSCGCYREARRRGVRKADFIDAWSQISGPDVGLVAAVQLHAHYRAAALKRGHCWLLSPVAFLRLVNSSCTYCGKPPSSLIRTKAGDVFSYNGIDRVDNSEGYTQANCVACCGICNRMKGVMSQAEFVAHLKRAGWHLQTASS